MFTSVGRYPASCRLNIYNLCITIMAPPSPPHLRVVLVVPAELRGEAREPRFEGARGHGLRAWRPELAEEVAERGGQLALGGQRGGLRGGEGRGEEGRRQAKGQRGSKGRGVRI